MICLGKTCRVNKQMVGNDVKGTNITDVSVSEVLHTCSTGKEINGTGIPILDRALSKNPRKKNSFAGHL